MGAPRVCLLHISKTSGTSVNLYLESQFRAEDVCPARSGDEFADIGRAKLAEFRLFRAECDASVLDFLPRAVPVVTLLREPVARAHSHWRYIQRLPEHRLHEQFQGSHGTFDHFLRSLPANPMARLIAARPLGAPRGLWEQRGDITDAALLERALARLESFAVVGTTERHDETVALIAHTFGWSPPGRLPVTNAGSPLAEPLLLGDDARALFEERNAVDLALYSAAREMLERRLRVDDDETRERAYERRLADECRPLERRQVVDLCGPVQGAGWLRVVETECGPVRPIGTGGTATIDLPVRLGRFTKIEITCPVVACDAAIESLELSVNGEVVAATARRDPEGVTVRAALPPTAPDAAFTRLKLQSHTGIAVPPNHTGALTDLEATIAVTRIELIPYDHRRLRPQTCVEEPPMRRAARFFACHGPAWTFDADLQRRIEQLGLWPRVEELQRDGFTVVPEVVGPDVVARARAAIRRLAMVSSHRTRARDVMQPLRVDPLFVDLLVEPVQLALADAVCGKGLLDSQAGLVRDRTSNPQGLHAENALWLPAPYPEHHFLCSSMLTLDRFDEAAGGTCFVPGSHLTRCDPPPDDALAMTGAVTPEVPPGSLIVWVGGTWHGARQRHLAGERVSLLTIFTRPSLRPAQDVRSIPDAIASTEELRTRLRRNDPFEQRGWYDGDPDAMLHWIRNTPRADAVTCEWGETIASSGASVVPPTVTGAGRPVGAGRPMP